MSIHSWRSWRNAIWGRSGAWGEGGEAGAWQGHTDKIGACFVATNQLLHMTVCGVLMARLLLSRAPQSEMTHCCLSGYAN